MRRQGWSSGRAVIAACALVSLLGIAAGDGDVEGPFVSNVTATSAVVWWQGLDGTAVPGRVVIGGLSLRDDEAPFEVTVTGLTAATEYEYHVELDDGRRLPAEGSYTLRTAPGPSSSGPFSFAVMCDSRGDGPSDPVREELLAVLLRDAVARGAEFIVFPGDLIFGYCNGRSVDDVEAQYRGQLREWKAAAGAIMHDVPVYVTMGNHDVLMNAAEDSVGEYDLDGAEPGGEGITGEEAFGEEFVNPRNGPQEPEAAGAPPYTENCYSFDYGNSHFVVLNTNYWVGTRMYPYRPGEPCRLYAKGNPEGRLMDRQLLWLREDLEKARQAGKRHIFVFGHEPAFPAGAHADDAMYYEGNATLSLKWDIRARRDRFWSMMSQYNVLVAFFGDEHNYSRSLIGPVGSDKCYHPPVWQIISGGAGAEPSGELRRDLPWGDSVRVFENRRHYCLMTVAGEGVSVEVYALPEDDDEGDGAESGEAGAGPEMEVIDRVADLTRRD